MYSEFSTSYFHLVALKSKRQSISRVTRESNDKNREQATDLRAVEKTRRIESLKFFTSISPLCEMRLIAARIHLFRARGEARKRNEKRFL